MSNQQRSKQKRLSKGAPARSAAPDIRLDVWPHVFAEDVIADHRGPLPRLNLGGGAPLPGDPESDAARFVRRLTELEHQFDYHRGYVAAYEALGLPARWVESLRRLRERDHPGFCRVYESPRALTATLGADGKLQSFREPELQPDGLYTLRLSVAAPAERAASHFTPATGKEPPVRPYRTGGAADLAIEHLADELRPKVERTFGGRRRLKNDPELVPICAAIASVWTVMGDPRMRTRHATPSWRGDVLEQACHAVAGLVDSIGVGQTQSRAAARAASRTGGCSTTELT